MKYWALDYIHDRVRLVYNDQLYATQEEAEAARAAMEHPEWFSISTYTPDQLDNYYLHRVTILDNLIVSV